MPSFYQIQMLAIDFFHFRVAQRIVEDLQIPQNAMRWIVRVIHCCVIIQRKHMIRPRRSRRGQLVVAIDAFAINV